MPKRVERDTSQPCILCDFSDSRARAIRGLIDLYVFFEEKEIAIEFDKGNRLRLKSICKLLQSDADTRIGVVRGNQRYNVWWSNKKRIAWIMRKLGILKKPILLIINSQKSDSWIYPFP